MYKILFIEIYNSTELNVKIKSKDLYSIYIQTYTNTTFIVFTTLKNIWTDKKSVKSVENVHLYMFGPKIMCHYMSATVFQLNVYFYFFRVIRGCLEPTSAWDFMVLNLETWMSKNLSTKSQESPIYRRYPTGLR